MGCDWLLYSSFYCLRVFILTNSNDKNVYTLIDNESDLSDLTSQLEDSNWLAIDTEFERVNTYYPKLCLLQISNGEIHAVIDPLSIDDMSPLYDLIYKDTIKKVLHSAHQDLEIFFNLKGTVPVPLFDTQIAAPLMGYAKGIGYGNLIFEVLDVSLDKGHARTDWTRRPLSDEQLRYAVDDVIYLGQVYELFIDKLTQENKLNPLIEQFSALSKSETYEPDPGRMWKKIFAARKLKGENLEILKHLAAWRELTARELNRPRKWIIPDHALVDMAKNKPDQKEALLEIDKVGEKTVKRHGDALLKIIAETGKI